MRNKLKEPTPLKWRRIGNICLAIGSVFIPFEAYMEMPDYVIFGSFLLTVFGKMFAEWHTVKAE